MENQRMQNPKYFSFDTKAHERLYSKTISSVECQHSIFDEDNKDSLCDVGQVEGQKYQANLAGMG
jgi:hypothetical protein